MYIYIHILVFPFLCYSSFLISLPTKISKLGYTHVFVSVHPVLCFFSNNTYSVSLTFTIHEHMPIYKPVLTAKTSAASQHWTTVQFLGLFPVPLCSHAILIYETSGRRRFYVWVEF